MIEAGPVGRALLALDSIQATPGITGDRLAARLGVSDRAAAVAQACEAGRSIRVAYRVGHGPLRQAVVDPPAELDPVRE